MFVTKKFCLLLTLLISCFYAYSSDIPYKTLGFPGINRKEVIALRNKYLTTHKKWLYDILEDGESYRIFVRKEIEKRKLPAILEYLPVVESDYKPAAKSRSGATGLWQFMLNSTRPYLICNEYVDERLDPWKSTEAALLKLQENYNMFGDWLLAITAYNCGAGTMQRALKKSAKKDFWALCDSKLLSEQAMQYVPKLLAVADVVENSAYYKSDFPAARDSNGESYISYGSFDYLKVTKSVSLSRLAAELRIDEDILKELNLALIKGVTPPAAEYSIRLPIGLGKTAEYVLRSLNPSL